MARPRVAFVGSGGAAKGVAHVGVLRAMQELGIEADICVGASAGAIAGAFYAEGYTPEQMIDWFRPFWQRGLESPPLKARYFLGLPNQEQRRSLGYLSSGLFSIDRFEAFVAEQLPHNDFRKLEKHLMVTAADVDGRGRIVFGRGYRDDISISKAVAASSCVPGLFRPYRIGDRFYIDGEVVRTLSIDLAVEAGADVVIISNVYRPHVGRVGSPSLVHQGGLAVVRQSLNIILNEKEKRGIDLIHKMYPQIQVLVVSPDLGRLPFTSRIHARTMLRRGYRDALRILAKAKRRGVFDVAPNVRSIGEA
ncbi:MAG: patatin-like phospholipase family protein [Polyangiales bacterium]|jgi:NTE family protein